MGKQLIKSVMGGLMIAIGTTIYISCDNKVVGSVLFSLGLLTIMFFGFNLFTGKIGYVRCKNDIFNSAFIFFGNMIGCFYISMFKLDKAATVVNSKLQLLDSPVELIGKSITCGIIIYICVEIFKRKNLWQITLIGIPLFILCGAEHCIADMCFFIAAKEFSFRGFLFIMFVAFGNAIGSILFSIIEKEEFFVKFKEKVRSTTNRP